MNGRGFLERSWFMRLVIIVWIVSSVFIMLFLNRLDGIVHGDLYSYGLQFDFSWATPFWSFERLIYICLAAPLALSGVALVWDFWKGRKSEDQPVRQAGKTFAERTQQPRENPMLISCPKCRKVFSKPLTMLDFSGGKTRLVNVCPYCNHALGSLEKKSPNSDIHIADLRDKPTQQNSRRA